MEQFPPLDVLERFGAPVAITVFFLGFMWKSFGRMTELAEKLSSQHSEAMKGQSERHQQTLATIGERCHQHHDDLLKRTLECITENSKALRAKAVQDGEIIAVLRSNRRNGP